MDFRTRITIDPARRSGRPRIRDLRITVHDVLEDLAAGMTKEQVVAELPALAANRERNVRIAPLGGASGTEGFVPRAKARAPSDSDLLQRATRALGALAETAERNGARESATLHDELAFAGASCEPGGEAREPEHDGKLDPP